MDKRYGESCSKILRGIFRGEVEAVTSALTPIEVANALRKYGVNREDVRNSIDAILSLGMEIYEIDRIDIAESIRISEEFDISPYDAVHIAIMKKADVTRIISADRDFDRVTGIERIDPEEL
ncbi:type II toxin-antitoxin system VapC family toxin [Candidatus Bathyarchaeota archaeon]|nr:type II toxin-antitoxin system VapC family toxin [Candidatus Bathyarchaeota archaeon]